MHTEPEAGLEPLTFNFYDSATSDEQKAIANLTVHKLQQIHNYFIPAVLLTPQLGQLFFLFVGGKGQRLHSEPKTREGKQQEKGSGGGSERLFVIMVQIQTC